MEKKTYIQPLSEVFTVYSAGILEEVIGLSAQKGGSEEDEEVVDQQGRHHSSWNESEEEENMWFHSSNLWE